MKSGDHVIGCCPVCRSEEITQIDLAPVACPVSCWWWDADEGRVNALDYDDSEVAWDSATFDHYECRECWARFRFPRAYTEA